MTQQNQQNPGQQVLWVLLRVSQANLSKIQPGGKVKATAGQRDQTTRHGGLEILAWLPPDGQVERAAGEADGNGHNDALDRLIRAQDEALKEAAGRP